MSKAELQAPQCRHSRVDYYLDPESQKYYAECDVCASVGPLRNTKKDAKEALMGIIAYREHGQGGYREGAGRPKTVPNTTKTRGFEVDDKRFNKFRKWMKTNGFNKNSPALRWIFDHLDKLKVPKSERADI